MFSVSSKIGDQVALWRLTILGERTLDQVIYTRVKKIFVADGAPNMLSLWDLIFELLDRDKERQSALSD